MTYICISIIIYIYGIYVNLMLLPGKYKRTYFFLLVFFFPVNKSAKCRERQGPLP